MFKKADGGLTAIVIIIIIIVFLGWLVNVANRECNKNSDCAKDEYCGVDYGCHEIPVITKTETPVQRTYNFIGPSVIIGIALIITAIILRWDKIKPKKQKSVETQTKIQPNYEYFTNFPPATNLKK